MSLIGKDDQAAPKVKDVNFLNKKYVNDAFQQTKTVRLSKIIYHI